MASSGHSTTSIPRPRNASAGDGRSSRTDSKGSASKGKAPKGSGTKGSGSKGKAPKGSGTKGSRGDERAGRTRDLTKPIPREKQLVTGSAKRIALIVGAVTVFAALAAATFWLPYGTLTRQDDDIARKEQELAALEQANAGLANEVDRLKTPEGIEEAAREEIGYVRRGELQLTVLPLPEAPTALPGGWPFDAAAQIVALRAAATPHDAPADSTP
jgi:cell division protein FtsB